jgi:hypothetical protein
MMMARMISMIRGGPRWRALAAATALSAAACSDSAPAEPTWADVAPILAANCVRCHGAPATGGAPPTFRLDRYDDVDSPSGRILGAASMAEWIALRTADGSMPPRFPIADHDVDVLANWFATRPPFSAGSPLLGPPRGAERKGNVPPVLTIAPSVLPAAIELSYQIRDSDRDLVVGQLEAILGVSVFDIGELHSGRGQLTFDTALATSGTYSLIATLDDGSGPQRIRVGEVAVTAPNPAPPRLTLRGPGQGSYVAASELPFEVEVEANDADTDALDVTVSLVDDRNPQTSIDSKRISVTSGSPRRVALGTATTPAGLIYRVVATVSDGTATHEAQSGRFRISRETTTDTFQTIADDILGPYCLLCHSSFPRTPNLPINLSMYQSTASAAGVYELRSRIYQRAVVAQTMPPGSERLRRGPLPAAERERLEKWLLAGAPQ